MKAEVPFGRPDEVYDLRGPEVNYFHNPWPSSIAGLLPTTHRWPKDEERDA